MIALKSYSQSESVDARVSFNSISVYTTYGIRSTVLSKYDRAKFSSRCEYTSGCISTCSVAMEYNNQKQMLHKTDNKTQRKESRYLKEKE